MTQRVWVELSAYERIVPRGTERVTWWVYAEDRWLSVRKHPDVELEAQSPAPQTIWQTTARLQLAPGSWLLRITRSPLSEPERDPMHYLGREARTVRTKIGRQYFRVGRRAELQRAKFADSPPELPDEHEGYDP